jgi:hypothetical protein
VNSVEQLGARQEPFEFTHLVEIHADEPHAHAILFAADNFRLALVLEQSRTGGA